MEKIQELLRLRKGQLQKALTRLEHSYKKVEKMPISSISDDDALEIWESFSARFSRASDIFLSQYLRTFVLFKETGFQGSLRDFIYTGEKLGLIDNADAWIKIRELRNTAADKYEDSDLAKIFQNFLEKAPRILKLKELI